MKCKRCGEENAELKRCCSRCGAFLEGYTINNVTGEYGYRGGDGRFYKTEEEYRRQAELEKKARMDFEEVLARNPLPIDEELRKRVTDIFRGGYVKAVQIGTNVTDIMKLPCVRSADKRDSRETEPAYYILDPFMMKHEVWQFAHKGDWLCADAGNKWYLLTDEEYQEMLKGGGE